MVTDNSLVQCIKDIRQALNDTPMRKIENCRQTRLSFCIAGGCDRWQCCGPRLTNSNGCGGWRGRRPAVARSSFHCGIAIRQYERRIPIRSTLPDGISGDLITGLSRIVAVRHRPQLDIRLQAPRGRRETGFARAWRALRAGRQRARAPARGYASPHS